MRGGHGLPILLPVLILALLMCLVVTAAPPDVNNRLLNLGRDELEAASGLTALAELWRGSHDVTGTTSIPSQVVTGGSDVIFSPQHKIVNRPDPKQGYPSKNHFISELSSATDQFPGLVDESPSSWQR
ncbi:hypothetical protein CAUPRSCDRAFT_12611 [Caulochytrium protostelioides]|uniref:Uncharacterized protein n=1 Tax=Caulochytrium protostelioides TaxID=1555241 RepID=A0A4P9WR59_9FUNG|nr:hypothetical protein CAUPRSCDRAFT_12611 [Caulochytrium protostelioides]